MLLSLKNTKDNERGPISMDRVIQAVHQANKRRDPVRFLCGPHGGRVGLYIDCPHALQSLMTRQLHGEYPTLDLEQVDDDAFAPGASHRIWHRQLTLRPDLYPIRRYNEFQETTREFSDPLGAILEAVAPDPKYGIRAYVEITTVPAPRWRRWRARRAVQRLARADFRHELELSRWYALGITHHRQYVRLFAWLWALPRRPAPQGVSAQDVTTSSSQTHERETDINAAHQKVRSFLFATHIGVLVAAPPDARCRALAKLTELEAVVSAAANPALASFRAADTRTAGTWPASSPGRPFLLSSEELATLFHPDTKHVAAASMVRNESRKPEPPHRLPLASGQPDLACLGRVRYRAQDDTFGIRPDDRRRHVYIPGKTGMGKTTLIQNMIMADIHAGRGVALLDPHGDLAETIIRSVPRKHWDRVVVFDPADDAHPVAYNPLACTDRYKRERIAGSVLSTFEHLYSRSWGPRMASVFRNALLAAVEMPDPTLVTVFHLLTDPTFRQRHVGRVSNPLVHKFWTQKFPSWNPRFRQEVIEPVLNKVEGFLTDPTLLRILGQGSNKLDLRDVMDQGKILVVNLSKGNLGEDASNLLGSLLVTTIQQAAMSRSDLPRDQRRDFYLYVDEFQNFATPAFGTILSEARKYRLNLIIAHQYLGQLDEDTRLAVFGNVGTMVAFALGGEDAQLLAEHLGGGVTPEDMVHLPKYHAYVALMIDGKTSDPFLMQTLKPAESLQGLKNYEALLNASRSRYATPADVVDRELRQQLAIV